MLATPATVLAAFRAQFLTQKDSIESAIAQLTDDQLRARLHEGANSIHIILKHIAGNLRSRFTDFLTTDGEKPWRDREREFRDEGETRDQLLQQWNEAWATLLTALDSLTDSDLARSVTIRGQPHTVPDALARSLAHIAYHAGQVLLLARLLRGSAEWKWITVPPGGSAAFNDAMARKHGEWRQPTT